MLTVLTKNLIVEVVVDLGIAEVAPETEETNTVAGADLRLRGNRGIDRHHQKGVRIIEANERRRSRQGSEDPRKG